MKFDKGSSEFNGLCREAWKDEKVVIFDCVIFRKKGEG